MSTASAVAAMRERSEELAHLLERFRDSVPGVVTTELASIDGLVVAASSGTDRDDAERLAAVAAGLHSLAMGIAGSGLEQAFIETATQRIFVMRAGDGTVLTVVTTVQADAGQVGHEMTVLIRAVGSHTATPSRVGEPASGGER